MQGGKGSAERKLDTYIIKDIKAVMQICFGEYITLIITNVAEFVLLMLQSNLSYSQKMYNSESKVSSRATHTLYTS